MNRNLLSAPIFLAVLISLSVGCSNYQLGFPSEASGADTSIYLLPVENNSSMAQLEAPLSARIRDAILRSPSLKLSESSTSSQKLRVVVSDWDRISLAKDPEDSGRPLSYEIRLKVTLFWESDDQAPWGPSPAKQLSVTHSVYSQPSLTEAEYQAIPTLAKKIADQIVLTLEGSW